MYETTSQKGQRQKVAGFSNLEMSRYIKLKAEETAHYTVLWFIKLFPMGIWMNNSDTFLHVHFYI